VPTLIGIGVNLALVYGRRRWLDVEPVIKLQEAQLRVEKQIHLTVGHVKNEKRIELELYVTLENGRVEDNGMGR